MTDAEKFEAAIASAEANSEFTEAVVRFQDGTRLYFCHRIDERWAKALGANDEQDGSGLAAASLGTLTKFRLNAKHLDINFSDRSRWERQLSVSGTASAEAESEP